MRTKVRIQSTSAIFVWRALRNFATDIAYVENGEEMVGTREAEVAAVATESGGTVATESGGAVATESGGAATIGDDRWGNVCGRRSVYNRRPPC